MTRSIKPHAVRMLLVAGFLGMATLIAPAATHAQITSPARASLNIPAFSSASKLPGGAQPSHAADGESALLGRSAVGVTEQPKISAGRIGKAQRADGEQALLNKAAASDTPATRIHRASSY